MSDTATEATRLGYAPPRFCRISPATPRRPTERVRQPKSVLRKYHADVVARQGRGFLAGVSHLIHGKVKLRSAKSRRFGFEVPPIMIRSPG